MALTKKTSRRSAARTTETPPQWYLDARASYSEANKLSLMGWYQVLAHRKQIMDGIYPLEAGWAGILQAPLAPRGAPFSREPIAPLHPTEVTELADYYAMPGYADEIREWTAAQGTGTAGDRILAQLFGHSPPAGALPDIHRRSLEFLKDGEEGVKSITDRFATTAHLSVDLRANDDVLTQWFQAWLRDERALMDEAGIAWRRPVRRGKYGKVRFSEADREQWAKLRLLDYIDFGIAFKVEAPPKLTDTILGGWLFPATKKDVTDRIRQQVRPAAEWLLSQPLLDAIHSQVVAEELLSRRIGRQTS